MCRQRVRATDDAEMSSLSISAGTKLMKNWERPGTMNALESAVQYAGH